MNILAAYNILPWRTELDRQQRRVQRIPFVPHVSNRRVHIQSILCYAHIAHFDRIVDRDAFAYLPIAVSKFPRYPPHPNEKLILRSYALDSGSSIPSPGRSKYNNIDETVHILAEY